MNRYIDDHNRNNRSTPNQYEATPKITKHFTKWDFIIGHALIIGASCFCQTGRSLFDSNDEEYKVWDTVIQKANFSQYMKLYRFKEFRYFLPKIHEQPFEKETDPWWRFSSAINNFNDTRNNLVISSWYKVLDESMAAWRPRTSKNGGFPNISYIIRKPEPLGTEFKTVCCPVTGVMIQIEIQRGTNDYD